VGGELTNEAGEFRLAAPYGQFYLLVENLGHRPFVKSALQLTPSSGTLDLGTLGMIPSAKNLEEVLIQAEKSTMELSLDKRVFNVGQDLANAGGTAIDILRNIPSLAVDVEGAISLRGSSNVRILIDGRPSGLVSFKGGAGLQQLQASMIERVEIITNPSARYEAEGMGGVINIVLKKDRKEGFNASFDIITGYPTNLGAAANLNYRRRNLNFFINYTASIRNTPGRRDLYQELYRNDSTFITEQTFVHNLKGWNNSARAGLDYFFSPTSVLTGAYTYRLSKGKRFSDLRYYDYVQTTRNQLGYTFRTQDEDETEPNSEYVLSYRKTFARKGHELVADIRLLDNWENSDQLFGQQDYLPNGQFARPYSLQRSVNYETEKQWLFQLDYVHPFGKEGKWEAGVRTSFRDMVNDFVLSERQENNQFVSIPEFTNYFIYNEQIHAAYGIIGNKSGRLSYQAGLRAEWTGIITTLRETNQVNDRSFANLFPSVHVTYDMAKQNALQLSYSRRVRRPQYNDLSPFMTFSDNRNFWSGNPDLNPEFTDAFELGHVKYLENGTFTSSLYYRYTTGKIMSIRRVNDEGFSTTFPENLATENAYGVEFTNSHTLTSWWKIDGSFNFFRAMIDGRNLDDSFRSDTYSWFVRSMSRFSFWGIEAQARANYEAPQLTPQGKRRYIATLDLAATKDILNNNATLTLSVLDVFNSRIYRNIMEGVNFYTETNALGRLRQVNLTFNYRIRQAKKKTKDIPSGEL
jgi:outer membrane receptor protein involved in Fe transport